MGEQGWTAWVEGLREGDFHVAQEFCARYGARLERLANRHLATRLQQRVGPEDVVQSACRTFFRRAGEGQFELADPADLWRLLSAITLAKVRKKAGHHLRQKRSLTRERPLDAAREGGAPAAAEPASREPGPEEVALFADELEHLLASLGDEQQEIVRLRLEDRSQAEIAEALGCSKRTVRRLLAGVREHLLERIGDGEG